MKRYLLFAGDYQHPKGGWNDFKGTFDTIEECEEYYKTSCYFCDWGYVVDTTTGLIDVEL